MTGSLVGYEGITPPSTSIFVELKRRVGLQDFGFGVTGQAAVKQGSDLDSYPGPGELSSKMGD